MKTSNFDFSLPPELIAQKPARPRESAKLLQVFSDGNFRDVYIKDLPALLKAGDLLVVNNTRVIPAQLSGKIFSTEKKVRVNLHKQKSNGVWLAFAKPAKKLLLNDKIFFSSTFFALITDKQPFGQITLKFNLVGATFLKALKKFGSMPLPPYIKRSGKVHPSDKTDYQTTFASRDGAVASPTAGLHFSMNLINDLKRCGIRVAPITLHVGAGTFLPIKTDTINHHRMHSEWVEINARTANLINKTRKAGGKIIAVGTTVLRTLETAVDTEGNIHPFKGKTDIFIAPGHQFKTVDLLITNFHLPKSTLFVLVSAFCGLNRMKNAYKYAIKKKYRFFSYGDASLLELRKKS
uniref:S-adenosylmethionine:tRNA ribosyltransferase-isomerase n=1 Tax=uncultured nuHF1 cluster bacterium HF0770_35I22 TaxID=723586 RepID=E7C7P2_9BACT|nr:S-adenosylmethionine:tRNA-ribosyltransferase-isomerase (queuine synthetase) [uncultured nuHF1 cluster bacterium HF0770_35I22]